MKLEKSYLYTSLLTLTMSVQHTLAMGVVETRFLTLSFNRIKNWPRTAQGARADFLTILLATTHITSCFTNDIKAENQLSVLRGHETLYEDIL